jgi:hypothetical protein
MDTQTPEQIAQHYKAALDSVALINAGSLKAWKPLTGLIALLVTRSI